MQTNVRRIAVCMCAVGIIFMTGCKHIPRGDIRLPERHHHFAQKSIALPSYIELDNGTAISMPQSYAERFTLVHEHLMTHIQSSPPSWIVTILEHDATVGAHVQTENELKGATQNIQNSMSLQGDRPQKDSTSFVADAKSIEVATLDVGVVEAVDVADVDAGGTTAPDRAIPDRAIPDHSGYAPAQNLLARMYLEGDGVKQDSARAFNLALSAARQGHCKAQVLVATLYSLGHGVTKNPEQAFFWAREAARDGEPEAMAMLADAYRLGSGTTQDDQEAFLWTMKASKAGVLRAHIWLGLYRHAMRRVGPSSRW
ncbi:MAG: tetratricopeptide repeat protein [Pseudomonadota bacterium]